MELLSAFIFCAILLCSNAQNQSYVAPADCNDTEKEAGVALDLINKHRTGGYIFTLLRVADAHVQHIENASIFYLTLDVLETECHVLSRKHWASCELGPFVSALDFGRCHAVIYINHLLRTERLYGYNCTMTSVPPRLYECKDCPVRITVLENAQQHTAKAEKILKKFNQDSNQTNYYKVDSVTKVIQGVADRTVYRVEFTIQETMCPKTNLQESGCEFLPDKPVHTGFCIGRILNGTEDLEGVEVETCEIFDIPHGASERHPIHQQQHNDTEEGHHPFNVSRDKCQCSGHRNRHRHRHHRHRPHHQQQHNDSGEGHHHYNVSGGKCQCPGHRHHYLHHHHHPPPQHHHHCFHHHCSPQHHHHHHHPQHHHHHHHHPQHHHHRHHHPQHHHHHHRPQQHHRIHRNCQGHHHHGPAEHVRHCNASKESQEKVYPAVPPPPGPRYPPPPLGGPHHFPPSQFLPPPAGPPPPPGQPFWEGPPHLPPHPPHYLYPSPSPPPPPHHHHPPHHPPEEPYFHSTTISPNGSQYSYQHVRRRKNTLHEREGANSSEEPDLFQSPDSLLRSEVYYIPLESEHDILPAPGADFSSPSQGEYKTPIAQPFPVTPSESCPGKLKVHLRVNLLSFYPTLQNRTHFH